MHLEQTKKKTTTDAWFYRRKQIVVRRNIPLRWNPEQPSHDGGSLLEAFQTCGRSLLTSELKRLFIVADISQSGMCGEEGRYPAVYVPIAKVASPALPPWLTSIDCFSRPQRRVSPSRGVVAASPRGKCRLLRGACRQNHRFHLVAAAAELQAWRRGCNVNRRRVSGHATLLRNLGQTKSIFIYISRTSQEEKLDQIIAALSSHCRISTNALKHMWYFRNNISVASPTSDNNFASRF